MSAHGPTSDARPLDFHGRRSIRRREVLGFAYRQTQACQVKLPIFGDAPVFGTRNQERRDLVQPFHHVLRVTQPPHMRITRSEKTVRWRPIRIFLH